MEFKSFSDFYPYYLREHSNITCKKCHFLGTCGVVALLILFFFTGNPILLWFIPVIGYGLSWIGHLIYQKNRPATLKYPFYSLMGDFRMFWDVLTGKISAF